MRRGHAPSYNKTYPTAPTTRSSRNGAIKSPRGMSTPNVRVTTKGATSASSSARATDTRTSSPRRLRTGSLTALPWRSRSGRSSPICCSTCSRLKGDGAVSPGINRATHLPSARCSSPHPGVAHAIRAAIPQPERLRARGDSLSLLVATLLAGALVRRWPLGVVPLLQKRPERKGVAVPPLFALPLTPVALLAHLPDAALLLAVLLAVPLFLDLFLRPCD